MRLNGSVAESHTVLHSLALEPTPNRLHSCLAAAIKGSAPLVFGPFLENSFLWALSLINLYDGPVILNMAGMKFVPPMRQVEL